METVEGCAWARARACPLYSLSHLGWGYNPDYGLLAAQGGCLRARLAGALTWPLLPGYIHPFPIAPPWEGKEAQPVPEWGCPENIWAQEFPRMNRDSPYGAFGQPSL